MRRAARDAYFTFFFVPYSAERLALTRIVFFALAFLNFAFLLPVNLSAYADVPEPFWMPSGYFALLGLSRLDAASLRALEALWLGTLILGGIGLATRLSIMTAFLLGAFILAYHGQFWGRYSHANAAFLLVVGIMALSRCADVYAVDRLIRGRPSRTELDRGREAGSYGWPIRLVCVLFTVTMFAAGLSKLRHTGLSWGWSNSLEKSILLAFQVDPEARNPLGMFLLRSPLLRGGAQWFSLAVEIAYPLVFVGKRLQWLFVGSGVLLLIGIRLTLGFTFYGLILCNAFWIPWDDVLRRVRARLGMVEPAGVIPNGARRSRQITAHAAIAIVLGGHAVMMAADREFYPFSAYPMFSHAKTFDPLDYRQVYGVTLDGAEVLLREHRYHTPMTSFPQFFAFGILQHDLRVPRENNDRHFEAPFPSQEKETRTRDALRGLLDRYNARRSAHHGPELAALRLYHLYWDDFSLATLDRPSRRVLVSEASAPRRRDGMAATTD